MKKGDDMVFTAFDQNAQTEGCANPLLNTLIFSSFVPGEAKHILEAARSEPEREMLNGEYCYMKTDYAGAIAHLENSIRADDPAIQAFSLWRYANSMANLGRFPEFIKTARELMAVPYEMDSDPIIKISQAGLMSSLFVPKESTRMMQELFSMKLDQLPLGYRLYMQSLRISIYLHSGKFSEVCALVETIFSLLPAAQYPALYSVLATHHAIARMFLGELERARELIRFSCSLLKPEGWMSSLIIASVFINTELINLIAEAWPECAEMLQANLRGYRANRIKAHNQWCNDLLITSLTKRQYDVAILCAYGMSNKEIANTLNISPNTVRTTLHHIFNRLDLNQRSDLSAYVYSFR